MMQKYMTILSYFFFSQIIENSDILHPSRFVNNLIITKSGKRKKKVIVSPKKRYRPMRNHFVLYRCPVHKHFAYDYYKRVDFPLILFMVSVVL